MKNVSASVRTRLTNYAKEHHEEFQLVLTRYVIERFLYRLSMSEHGDQFILKGAMLFQLWTEVPHRATQDVDLLGKGDNSVKRIAAVIQDICKTPVADDGLTFDPEKVAVDRIQEDAEYQGVRVTCQVRLGQARIPLQVDIGFGDAVTPRPTKVQYPTLLEFPAPVLPAYLKTTVVAEKFQAMVALGLGNSRMKDFFDLWILSRDFSFEGVEFTRAIGATFRRRKTPLPSEPPIALTTIFGEDVDKKKQWQAFLRKGKLDAGGKSLEEICALLHDFLMPPVRALATKTDSHISWPPGGPWRHSK